MGWDIEPTAARNAVTKALDLCSGIDDVSQSIADTFADITVTAKSAPHTAQELLNVSGDPFLVTTAALRRYVNNVAAVVNKTIDVYLAGDESMATQTQAELKSVTP